jgi:hypothetical protein
MIDAKDVRGLKLARVEFGRRGIDISRADLRVQRGILTIRGVLLKGNIRSIDDFKVELEHAFRHLKGRTEIRDIQMEAMILN